VSGEADIWRNQWRTKIKGFFVSDSIVLVCAVFASLASGVLLAYGICIAIFALFQQHARQSPVQSKVPTKVRVANSATTVEG